MSEARDLFDDPPKDARTALIDLLEQIDRSEFTDELGHRLKMNIAYHNAKAVLAGEAELSSAPPNDVPPEYRTWQTGP